jgi:hypothetical protein
MRSHRFAALTALSLGLGLTLWAPDAMAKTRLHHHVNGARATSGDPALPPYPRADVTTSDDTTVTSPDPAAYVAPSTDEPSGPVPRGTPGRLADWVAESDDNGDLPFIIVDKLGARVFAFNAAGEFLGSAPALLGLARGDDSAAGVGGLKLSEISDDQRTTPAGRFVAGFGKSDGHGTMLWVDLPDAIALHPVMSVNAGEHRQQRIKSSDPSDHRISYGCINVPKTFYDNVVLAALGGGNAIVYVLPDTKSVDEVFPVFAASDRDPRDRAPQVKQYTRADIASQAPVRMPETQVSDDDPLNDPIAP